MIKITLIVSFVLTCLVVLLFLYLEILLWQIKNYIRKVLLELPEGIKEKEELRGLYNRMSKVNLTNGIPSVMEDLKFIDNRFRVIANNLKDID